MRCVLVFSLAVNAALLCVHFVGPNPADAGGGGGVPGPVSNGDVNGDRAIDISDAVYLLANLFQGGPPPAKLQCRTDIVASALPATGQTVCYDSFGGEIGCDTTDYPGQDGSVQAGCPRSGRFIDNGDGTIVDTCTGLMWQQVTPLELYDWQEALIYCDRLEFAGFRDWRLPNVLELLSIQDYGRLAPSLDPAFGPVGSEFWYWSSSSAQDAPQLGWIVSFAVGIAKGWTKAAPYHVRAVRTIRD